jgi:hypothetical protein
LGSTWEKPRRYALKTGERRSLKTLGFLRNRLLERQMVAVQPAGELRIFVHSAQLDCAELFSLLHSPLPATYK